jgi:signal transduction histidine kinase/ActR/RegA family two-component response regulator
MASRSRSVPLRRRLFLLAAAGILPLAVMAGVALHALFEQQRQQAERSTLEITRALATAADAELRRSISVLEALATAVPASPREMEAFDQRLRRVGEQHPNWHGLNLSAVDGQQLVDTQYPRGQKLRPIAEMASFRGVIETGKPAVGNLFERADGDWSVPIRVPVVRDGEIRHVLSALVKPDSMLELVTRQRLEEGWVVTATDARGTRVLRWPRQSQYVGSPITGTLQKMMATGAREGTGITTTSEGREVYTAFSRSPQSGWALAVGIPRDAIEAAAWRSIATFGSGLALSMLIAALAALVIARSINKPMAQLRAAAQAVGKVGEPPPVHTSIREIDEVSRALALSSHQRLEAERGRLALLKRERAARAAAESANRAKDEFLAMLGHELRNPLGAAANAANVLQRPGADDRAKAQAGAIISRQVAHLSRLTDDLLDAGRALMGKIVLRRETVSLAIAASQSLATLRAAGKLERHRITQHFEDVWADVDPIRLDQVICNLVVNATKYTPAQGHVHVAVERDGDEAVIRVVDNGIGLSPELAARAFDLFVQGERALDRAEGGLGIGLTLVRRLAELHGGSVSVRSEGSGKGSEFTVRLPAVEAPAERRAAPRTEPAASRHILVIEDNEDARETLSTLLGISGHRVDTAGDGVSGLESALASHPDVALVDIGLPRMDGYEVARRLRGAGGGYRPYLVALTGYGSPEDRARAIEAGFDNHLVKPVDHALLDEVLADLPRGEASRAAHGAHA